MPSEDSKTVKKEEADEDEAHNKPLKLALENKKKKPNTPSSKSPLPKEAKVKKEERKTPAKNQASKVKEDEDDSDFEQPTYKKPPNKAKKEEAGNADKKKGTKGAAQGGKEEDEKKRGSKGTEQTGKKKEKKVYDLPGQKRVPPEERDPLRIFYETLYQQVPDSEMAAFWMMESGLLPLDVARKVFEKKQKKSQQQKLSSPTKTVVTMRSTGSVTVKTKATSPAVSAQKKSLTKAPRSAEAERKLSAERGRNEDGSSDDGSDEDFGSVPPKAKKQRAA